MILCDIIISREEAFLSTNYTTTAYDYLQSCSKNVQKIFGNIKYINAIIKIEKKTPTFI